MDHKQSSSLAFHLSGVVHDSDCCVPMVDKDLRPFCFNVLIFNLNYSKFF